MYVIPAIDLRHQKCVRLYQGDYAKETVYAEDPIKVAQEFAQLGSQWLHVVDLDGAKDPLLHQRELIAQICKHTSLHVQTGGGIRTIDQVEELLNLGVKRVIIGSLAVKEPQQVKAWLKEFGAQRIVLAVDVKADQSGDYDVAIHGWQENSQQKLFDFLKDYQAHGLTHVLCTDISLDGTLKGPNIALYDQILQRFPELKLQASGGVGRLEDIVALHEHSLSACIVGRALYEGNIRLDEAIGSVYHAC